MLTGPAPHEGAPVDAWGQAERAYPYCVSTESQAMTVTVGGIEFDRVDYDAEADVLYLHVGDPSTAVEFDETPEGHHVRLDAEGRLVGLTLVNPRYLLETDGEVRISLPVAERVEADQLLAVLG